MEASFLDAIEMLVNSEGLLLASVDKTGEHLILQKPPPPTMAKKQEEERESTADEEERESTADEEEPFLAKEEINEDESEDAEEEEKVCCELDDSDFEVDPVVIPLDAVRQLNDSRMQLQLWKGMAIGFAACFAGVIFHTC
jgi:hypothetical protein